VRGVAAGTGGSSSERRRRHFRLFLREAIFLRASRCRWSCSLVPWLRRRLTGHEEGITLLQRMGVGMVLSVMTMLVSGIGRAAPARAHGAARRREEELHLVHVVEPRLPMSAFWLMPQLAALGLSEMFNQVSQMEFYIYYKQFPEKMRRRPPLLFSDLALSSYFSGSTRLLPPGGRGVRGGGRDGRVEQRLDGGGGGTFSSPFALAGFAAPLGPVGLPHTAASTMRA